MSHCRQTLCVVLLDAATIMAAEHSCTSDVCSGLAAVPASMPNADKKAGACRGRCNQQHGCVAEQARDMAVLPPEVAVWRCTGSTTRACSNLPRSRQHHPYGLYVQFPQSLQTPSSCAQSSAACAPCQQHSAVTLPIAGLCPGLVHRLGALGSHSLLVG